MANNYFSCVVSGNKTYLRDPDGRMKLLNLCKDGKAFFLEKGQPEGALSEVCAGDIIFLSFRQYIVAYGEVTDILYDGLDNSGFSCAIRVKKWIGPICDYKRGVFIRKNVLKFSVSSTSIWDKIKKLEREMDARRLMSQLH